MTMTTRTRRWWLTRGGLIRPTWIHCPYCAELVATPGLGRMGLRVYLTVAPAVAAGAGSSTIADHAWITALGLYLVAAGHFVWLWHLNRMPRGVDLRPIPGDTLASWSTGPAATASAAESAAPPAGDSPGPGSAPSAPRRP